MALKLEIGRPHVPSERELAAGVAPPPVRALEQGLGTGAAAAADAEQGRGRLRAAVDELRPKVVTRGEPRTPMVALTVAGTALAMQNQAFLFFTPMVPSILHGANILVIGTLVGAVSGFLSNFGGIGLGYIADQYLPRVIFLRVGYVLSNAMTVLTGFSNSAVSYTATATGRGVGLAVANPGNAVIGDVYSTEVSVRQQYFQAKVNALGVLGAMPLAAAVAVLFNWQWALVAFGIMGMVAALPTFMVKEPPRAVTVTPRLSLPEALRVVWSTRSIRYTYFALAATGLLGVYVIAGAQVYLASGFHLGLMARAFIGAAAGLGALAALFLQGPLQARVAGQRPGRLLFVSGLLLIGVVVAVPLILFSGSLPVAIVAYVVAVGFITPVGPSLIFPFQIALPTRARALGLDLVGLVNLAVTIPFGLLLLLVAPAVNSLVAPYITGYAGEALFLVMAAPVAVIGAVLTVMAGTQLDRDLRTREAAEAAETEVESSRAAGRGKVIVCRDLDVHYQGAQVLFGVDFDVAEGELVALLGTNGAGKSTLLRAIAGVHAASAGAVFVHGENITHAPAHQVAARGVVMVPGGRAVFPRLTVAENLRAAAWLQRRDQAFQRETTEAMLGHFPVLRTRAATLAGDLSGGEQQQLALAQAFLMRPRLLLIDELSLGLAPEVVERLLEIVRAINAAGTTVVLVEQSVNVAMSIARRCVFMEKGEIRYEGPTADLLENREILRSVFLGGTRGASMPGSAPVRLPEAEREVALRVDDARVSYRGVHALDGVSLELRAGEITGIVGPNGAGKTTLFDAISGFASLDSGRVALAGTDVTTLPPDARARLGLTRSFQNVSLFGNLTVRENLLITMERHLESRSLVAATLALPGYRRSERRAGRRADALIERFGLMAYANKFVRELSIGTRRVLDIACVLAADPTVLLLDEPSSGLAQAETEELGPFISRIRKETGSAILVIEHDINLVSSVADRLVAMRLGAVMRDGEPREVLDDPQVAMALMGGAVTVSRSGAATPVGMSL